MNVPAPPCAVDPGRWYDPNQVVAAKTVCLTCPARGNCLTLALEADEPWGVWGGYTEAERRRLKAGQQPRVCRTCRLQFVPRRPSSTDCEACGDAAGRAVADDVDEIARLAAAGWTDVQIGDALGWSAHSIRRLRHQNNIAGLIRPGQHARDRQFQPCGTTAAYRRHLRRKEPIDEACRQANNLARAGSRSVAAHA